MFTMLPFASGQQFPVSASTQIIPPYSVYLADYAVPGSDKLRVILLQSDLTTASYDVSLQMTVEKNGTVIMRTAGYFRPRPLTLVAGVPTIIAGSDLGDYLNSNNIEFTGGYSRDQYEATKSLPEGAYKISFTAFDYRRPAVQVSNAGGNVFYFQKSDPPLLNMPVCGSRVEKRDPQFLSFNWSSRNTTNGSTEYVFSLYEVKPAGSTPDYIVRSAVPIYTLTTDNNTIIYGPGEPLLVDSMQYVWRVQARDKNGKDLFANQGYSTSCTFTYHGNNPFEQLAIGKPVLSGAASGERGINYHWAPGTGYDVASYRLQYRAAKKNNVEFDWQVQESAADTSYELRSLEPARTYEAKLQWQIGGVYGPFSDMMTITTDSAKTFVCGDGNLPSISSNTKPQASLITGRILKVGHYDVILTKVTGSNGTFSGNGYVITPGFGIGLQVVFKDITVNTDLVVIKGEMAAVTKGIDKFVEEAVEAQRGGDDVGRVVTGNVVPDVTTTLPVLTVSQVKVDTVTGRITISNADNTKSEVIDLAAKGKALPVLIEDAEGRLYNVDKKGNVSYAGQRSTTNVNATLDISAGKVTFAADKDNKYAFDEWKAAYAGKTVLERSYESLADGKYRVSAKAIVPSVQEKVIATLEGSADTTGIRFVSGKGIIYPAVRDGNKYTITVTGGPAGDAQEIYAVRNKVSLGKLLVASYEVKAKKVILVPVGYRTTVPAEAVQRALKQAYAGIGLNYTVETDGSFRYNKAWDSNGDSLLQDSKSAFLGNGFTGEEKALKKAYVKSLDKVDDNAVYLFVMNEAALKDGDLLGKMPRQSQFGFVFAGGASAEDIGRTVAHEIGHGDFTLEHVFSAGIGLSAGSTENLMDYNGGYQLFKYQWDVAHDPGSVWGIFEDDAEGELIKNSYILVTDHLLPGISATDYGYDGYINYVTPAGEIISLKNDVKVTFEGYLETNNGTANQLSSDAKGFLMGFVENGVNWVAGFSRGVFVGYTSTVNPSVKYSYKPLPSTAKVVAGLEVNSCELGIFVGDYTPRVIRYHEFHEMIYPNSTYKLIGAYKAKGSSCVSCSIDFKKKPWALQKVLAVMNVNGEDSKALDDLLEAVNIETMRNFLCVEERFFLIKCLSHPPVAGADELSIINLINSTPDDQVQDLLNAFETDSTTLLRKLHTGIDGDDNLKAYYGAMHTLWLRSKTAQEWAQLQAGFNARQEELALGEYKNQPGYLQDLAKQNVFYSKLYYKSDWDEENVVSYSIEWRERFTQNGHVVFGYKDWTKENFNTEIEKPPFEMVKLITKGKDGVQKEVFVPAMYLMYVGNDALNYEIETAINTTVIVLGAATLSTVGLGPWAYLWATADILVASGNLYILNEKEELSATPGGKAFMSKWQTMNLILAGGQGLRLVYNVAQNVRFAAAMTELKDAYQEFKYKDWEELRIANPELAAKLEAFGMRGIATLEKLQVEAALKMQQMLRDAAEINQRYLVLGEDLDRVLTWMKDPGDEYFFVVIHSTGEEFSIIHNGEMELLDGNSLLKYLETHNIPATRKVVLLSCNNIESVKKLAAEWGRDIISSDGVVRLYKNGTIEAEGGLKLVKSDGSVANTEIKGVSDVKHFDEAEEFVELGKGKNKTPSAVKAEVEAREAKAAKAKADALELANKNHRKGIPQKYLQPDYLANEVFDENGIAIGQYKEGGYIAVYNDGPALYGSNVIDISAQKITTFTGVLDPDMDYLRKVYYAAKKSGKVMGEGKGTINILASNEWNLIKSRLSYIKQDGEVNKILKNIKEFKRANAKYILENNLTSGYTTKELEELRYVAENGFAKGEEAVLNGLFNGGKMTRESIYYKIVKEEFWKKVNRPWLQHIIDRGDDIRFVSDPSRLENLYFNGIETEHYKSIFGMELDLLERYKGLYKIDMVKGTATKL
jgi:hypothetical protein